MKIPLRFSSCLFFFFCMINATIQAQTWQWAKKAGGAQKDFATSIAVDEDGNSFITGKFYDSISFDSIVLSSPGLWSVYIAQYDAEGNFIWAKIAASGYSIDV